MASLIHTIGTTLLLLIVVSRAGAQGQASPSGHWEGTVQIPGMELMVEVDLQAKDKSTFAGTFSQPVQGVKGLPLSTVAVDGKSVRFVVRGGEAPATFEGLLSDDGTAITGKVEQ